MTHFARAALAASPFAEGSTKMHLLFVDDDQDICDNVETWVEEIKDDRGQKRINDLTIVNTKNDAIKTILQIIGDSKYAPLLILDLSVDGDKNFGFNVLDELKQINSRSLQMPIIVYSSSNDKNDIANSYLKFANSYVCKGPGAKQKERFRDLILYWTQTAVVLPHASLS